VEGTSTERTINGKMRIKKQERTERNDGQIIEGTKTNQRRVERSDDRK
jgi:hypothetical protein